MNRDQMMQLPELINFQGKEEIKKVWYDGNQMAVLARGSFHLHCHGKWYEFGPHNLEDFVMNGNRALALDSNGFLLYQENVFKRYDYNNSFEPFCYLAMLEGIQFVKIGGMAIGRDLFFAMAQDGGLFECSFRNGQAVYIRYELDWSLYDICDSEPANLEMTQLLCTYGYPMVLSSCGKVFFPENLPVEKKSGIHCKKLQIHGKKLIGKKVIELAVGQKFSFALTDSGELYKWITDKVYDESVQMMDYINHTYQSRGKMIWASNCQNLVVVLLESGSFVSVKLTDCGDVLAKSIFSSTLAIHNFKAFKVNGCLYNGVRKLRSTEIKDMWMGKLEAIFDQEDASDLIIEAEGKPIHCHKSFVSAHCEYLKNWIKNEDLKEYAGEKLRLCSKDLKYESLHTILNYFYTGRLEFHSFDITLNLIEVTEMWVEKEMQKFFVDQAIQYLSFENAHLAKKIADKLEIEVLKEACIFRNPELYFVKS